MQYIHFLRATDAMRGLYLAVISNEVGQKSWSYTNLTVECEFNQNNIEIRGVSIGNLQFAVNFLGPNAQNPWLVQRKFACQNFCYDLFLNQY